MEPKESFRQGASDTPSIHIFAKIGNIASIADK